jgi:hypothetical protein
MLSCTILFVIIICTNECDVQMYRYSPPLLPLATNNGVANNNHPSGMALSPQGPSSNGMRVTSFVPTPPLQPPPT